jgi:hypothetical protein
MTPVATRITLRALATAALAVTLLLPLARAGIERLDLAQMVQRAEGAVHGTIVAKHSFRVDSPIDGPELYFTRLTIEGNTLAEGRSIIVDVIYLGGFIDADHGAWNSESPSEKETRIGRQVVAFYTWTDNMGGGVAGNLLYASHGGLYGTFKTLSGRAIVQGRGEGYALRTNAPLNDVCERVARLRAQQETQTPIAPRGKCA